jgi:hypothetical protein
MALDRHEQLMLDMGQADRAGPILAPALETAQGDAEGEEVLEVLPGGLRQGDTPVRRSSRVSLRLPAIDRNGPNRRARSARMEQ